MTGPDPAAGARHDERRRPGLYLHVPFCATVCPYCDFSVLVGDAERRERFVDSLVAELDLWSAGAPPHELRGFDTIYLGGGTPSMLEAEQLERLLSAVRARLELLPEPWIFLEANPEDVTAERAGAWRALGVRFLSLGVQSFDDGELRFLGRLHDARRAREAAELARDAGFETVSLDLIYGLPDQSESTWRGSLEAAVALAPDHLSCYQLTVHEKTAFGVRRRRGELVEMPDDEQAERFLFTHRFLAGAGYPGYEISNFARAEAHRSAHNMKYWDHTPYLGLGPSAHSFAGRRRWWNLRGLGAWQAAVDAGASPVGDSEELDAGALALERLMLGLRTRDGVEVETMRSRYGLELEAGAGAARVDELESRGLIRRESGRLRPTLEGWAIADTLALDLDGAIAAG